MNKISTQAEANKKIIESFSALETITALKETKNQES